MSSGKENICAWKTIVKLKKGSDANIHGSFMQDKHDDEYLIIGYPMNLKGELMFHMVEFDESMNPPTGICSCIVTEEEFEKHFDIIGEYKNK